MVEFKGFESLIKTVYDRNQQHVFEFWNELADDEKGILLSELADVDFDLLEKLYHQKHEVYVHDFDPAPYIGLPTDEKGVKEFEEAEAAGIAHIRDGRVCAFMVAGGQGSRLGYEGPKGKFPVGPVSGKTLFQIHGDKILKYSRKYKAEIPWLVMTSNLNHDETAAYFEENNFFGLNPNSVMLFPQKMIPSLDLEGKLILSTRNTLFRNPDGHGGSLTVLASSGALAAIKKRGIDTISYFQVDNPLVKILDPVFIGFHLKNRAEISSKAVEKLYPEEKVGVFVRFQNGRIGVVEYSDLHRDKASALDEKGRLRFSCGSIAIHLFSVNFIERITSGRDASLPYHVARKKIESYRSKAHHKIDGLKFEKFVFDALPLTDKNIVFETVREEEFAPVKNPTGEDSVHSARKLMMDLHRSWLKQRGIRVPPAAEMIEISPLAAVEAGDLSSDIVLPEEKKFYVS